jgi:hypothetical protein
VFVSAEAGVVRPLLNTGATEGDAQVSRDGGLIAYTSNETGRQEVFVQRYPPDGSKWQLSADGGTSPMWARNGRELFRSGNDMVSVTIDPIPAFSHGPRVVLFNRALAIQRFAVTADAQRFLVLVRDPGAPPPRPHRSPSSSTGASN